MEVGIEPVLFVSWRFRWPTDDVGELKVETGIRCGVGVIVPKCDELEAGDQHLTDRFLPRAATVGQVELVGTQPSHLAHGAKVDGDGAAQSRVEGLDILPVSWKTSLL